MAIAFVQDDNALDSTSGSTLGVAFGSNVTAGNLIVVMATWAGAGDVTPTVSDTLSNTYVEIGSHIFSMTADVGMSMFYAANITGGANTVTVNYTASRVFREIMVAEYSGASTTSPLDTSAFTVDGTATTSTDSATTPAVTPAQNASLLVGFISSVSGMGTAAAGTNYTERIDTTGGGGGFAEYEDRILAIAASVAATWTVSVSGAGMYNARVAVFKPPAAGGTTSGRGLPMTGMGR